MPDDDDQPQDITCSGGITLPAAGAGNAAHDQD